MTGSICAKLADRALIRLAGPDTRHFLQNLITCDIENLADGEAAFGALLTPQGKILFDFFVIANGSDFIIDTANSHADGLLKRLKFYKLRAKVEIERIDDMAVHACWSSKPAPNGGLLVADPRLEAMGWRLYSAEIPEGEAGDYNAHRIGVGMPEGGQDFAYGEAFPHEALMDQNGGVDFSKGCFVGQEVVSRMQHRGTARKRVVVVENDDGLPAAGADVTAGQKTAGVMGSSHGHTGLALVRLDRIAASAASGDAVAADGKRIEVRLQPWVGFGWPE